MGIDGMGTESNGEGMRAKYMGVKDMGEAMGVGDMSVGACSY